MPRGLLNRRASSLGDHLENAKTRYSLALITLHWLMLALIIAVYFAIEYREFLPRGSDERAATKAWHFTLGLTVFSLAVARLIVKAFSPVPAIVPPPPNWQRLVSSVVHVALYALMLGMPIAGWLILSGEGDPIPFWFGIELPPLIAPNKELAETIEEVHETFGKIGYGLIALHAAAGLAHHYLFRDNTLKRMLP